VPRFVLLEHVGHPEDPAGLHYDLLLEEGDVCRTWRLVTIPVGGGEPVVAEPLPPHRLAWLDIESSEVSGGRGFARRIDAGTYAMTDGAAPDVLDVVVSGTLVTGRIMGVSPRGRIHDAP
jgi:hypothetical protein